MARVRDLRSEGLAAFNSLVEAHQRRVYNLCYRTLGNAEDAADATQETFLRAYRGYAEFRSDPERIGAWLLRIAVNTCYDQLRRQKRRPSQSLEALSAPDRGHDVAGEPVALADPAPGPEQRALSAEAQRMVESALATLSADHRLVLVLCDVQGLSYGEAAEVLDVELGTVKSRLSRARAALRAALAARGELLPASERLD
jgi:RNA polymerase sigma-70 factor, ECF subfamily